MGIDILKIRNQETKEWEKIPAIKGEKGEKGDPGESGVTPVRGTDYWTAADKEEIVEETKSSIDFSPYVTTEAMNTELAKKANLIQGTAGQLKAFCMNGLVQDQCLISNTGAGNAITRYTAGGQIVVVTPTADSHAATKAYVDTADKALLPKAGGTMTGALTLSGAPTEDLQASTKKYVDDSVGNKVTKTGITVAAGDIVNVHMESGVYLVTAASTTHKGLVCATVYDSGESIDELVSPQNWTCGLMPTNNRGITLKNTGAAAVTIYITSLGENNYTNS